MALNITGPPFPFPFDIGIQGIVLYPIEPYLVFVFAALIIGAFQWSSFLHTKLNSRPSSVQDEESARSRRGTSTFKIPLAIVNLYRVLAFRTTIGFGSYLINFAEVFAIAAYVALLLVWTYVSTYDPDSEPLNWNSRAALLAASQFPVITILGTKNNIVSLITRISSDKLNFIHRLAARACMIFVIIHATGGGFNFWFHIPDSDIFVRFGLVAASMFGALIVISIRPIRERAYEFFFYFHFVAVIVILVAVILHIYNFSGVGFTYYIWPSFVIWAADRLIRTSRLLYFNLASREGALDATTELLSDNLVRVRCCRPKNFHWSPGQYAYIIIPSVSRLPFEAHPFSIANVDSDLFAPDTKGAKDPFEKELVFIIGVKNGFTRRLKDFAARRERVKVYVDGPYGEVLHLGCYNTSLLIAGGTGITFALPALLNAVESVKNASSCCRRVVLIWSIRDADFLNHVSEQLAKAVRFAPPGLEVDIRIFLTNSISSTALESQAKFVVDHANPSGEQVLFSSPTSSEKPEHSAHVPSWLKVSYGRPNLEHIINEEINAADGRVSVSVCGPNGMTKHVRKALRIPVWSSSSPLNGGPSVTLHVESFGYA